MMEREGWCSKFYLRRKGRMVIPLTVLVIRELEQVFKGKKKYYFSIRHTKSGDLRDIQTKMVQ